MKITDAITLDLSGSNELIRVMAKQYDKNSRVIQCTFVQNGAELKLSEEVHPRMFMKKPDGKFIMMDGRLSGNTAIYELPQQSLTAFGIARCEVQLYQQESLLSASSFSLVIFPSVYTPDEIESSTEYQSFVDALCAMERWESEEEARKKAEAERMLNEQQRQQEETARQEAEGSRAGAEIARAAAEEERAAGFEALKAESQAGSAYAKEQGDYAKVQGEYAKEQGDYAKEQYDRFKDIDVSGLQTDLEELTESVGQPNGIATLDGEGKLAQRTGLATLDGNGKLSLEEVPSANSMGLWNLGEAEAIPSGADLDTYSTPGTYLSPSATVSGNIQNTPWTASGYKLIVQTNQNVDYLCQTAYTGTAMKLRRSNAGEWSDWEEVYISSSNPSTRKTQRNNLGIVQGLWSGSWSSGTITVPNLQNYSVYKVIMQDMGTAMICFRHGNFFRGMGGYTTSTPTVTYYQMAATISGNNMTMVASNAMKANGDNTFSDTVITNIVGIC